MPQTKNNLSLSIIICTYNREDLLLLALNSVKRQTISNDQIELIIINNNSTDSTVDICNDFIRSNPDLNVKYFDEKLQGLSFARNRGIKEADGELVTFIDDDAVLAEDFCEEVVGFFGSHDSINAAGGKILLQYLENKPAWYNPYIASLLGYFNPGNRAKIFKHGYFRGSNMSFRRNIFSTHSPFNTNLGRVGRNLAGSEEKEIFYRLKESGELIWYLPTAIVYHLVPPERMGMDFIKHQAIGAGNSQRDMMKMKSPLHYYLAIIKELAKWIASLLLSIAYLLMLRGQISIVLIRFRFWVSSGLFQKIS